MPSVGLKTLLAVVPPVHPQLIRESFLRHGRSVGFKKTGMFELGSFQHEKRIRHQRRIFAAMLQKHFQVVALHPAREFHVGALLQGKHQTNSELRNHQGVGDEGGRVLDLADAAQNPFALIRVAGQSSTPFRSREYTICDETRCFVF